MARVFNGSTQYLSRASAVVSAMPLTMACFFRTTSTTAIQRLIDVGQLSSGNQKWSLALLGTAAAPNTTVIANTSSVNGAYAATTAAYSANTWHHAAAVYESATSRTAYLDGGNAGTDTVSVSPSGVDTTTIGATGVGASAFGQFMSGRIAEAAIWSVALTAAEIAALARGFIPPQIRPQSLVAYWPLGGRYGQFDLDRWKSSLNMTPTNSPTWADHDRIIYPQPVVWPQRVAAVGGATPWLYARRRSQTIGAGGVH